MGHHGFSGISKPMVFTRQAWWAFPPPKKTFSPTPKFPQFTADTLPAPRLPLLKTPPPRPRISIKNRPPPPGASDSPFPLPEQKKKIYIRNVHQARKGFFRRGFLQTCTIEAKMIAELIRFQPEICSCNGNELEFKERICICNESFSAEIPTDLSL